MDSTAAPTITIDGVTSRPAEPVTMTGFACGCNPILMGHSAQVGDTVECDDHDCFTTVTQAVQTWMF